MVYCDLCNVDFDNNITNYNRHVAGKKHKQRLNAFLPQQCIQCNLAFNHESHYQTHLTSKHHLTNSNTNHETNTYNCTVCNQSFGCHYSNFNQHLLSAKHVKRAAAIPTTTTTNAHAFPSTSITAEESWTCSECSEQFTTHIALKTHFIKTHALDKKKKFKCKKCNHAFSSLYLLNKHMRLHINGHACPHCNSKFMYKRTQLQHIKRVHPPQKSSVVSMPKRTNNKLECFNCKKAFVTRWALNRHLKIECNAQCIPNIDHLWQLSAILK
jgi:DNA-directed RNA polymerase subunit RPC12/RpoP